MLRPSETKDGRYTYVITRVDPGVHNWLDAAGLDVGGTTVRFQGLKDATIDYSDAFHVWHGKLADIDSVLPAETVRVTPEERAAQIEKRVAAIAAERWRC